MRGIKEEKIKKNEKEVEVGLYARGPEGSEDVDFVLITNSKIGRHFE